MMTSKELAIEVVRVSTRDALVDAARSESLSDLIGSHEGTLRARLGSWSGAAEGRAVAILAAACEDAIEDDATDDQVIEYIRRMRE